MRRGRNMHTTACKLVAFALGTILLTGLDACAHANSTTSRPWWRGAIIYEIYPRSFQDSNGDGIGDLNGITSRLDYIKSLGVDAIWLTPIYPSPQVDFGYDISNYEAIDPQYGTMKDFDRLVTEAKKRHIRIIMDLVLNHTSDKHPWFLESESSHDNPKRNWYIWRNGKNGGPPNNWQSVFGHSAWQYDAKTGQYYYHKFYIQQPDLNWRNPEVQKAMYDVERFWIKRGVAGFRLDAITNIFKDPKFRDESIIRDKTGKPVINAYGDVEVTDRYSSNLPEVHGVLRQLRRVADSYEGRNIVLIGETWVGSVTELRKMYGAHDDELQLPMDLQVGFIDKFDTNRFRTLINDAETGIGGNEPLFVLDNHDKPRWDRYGDGVHNQDIGRVLSTVIILSRDTAMYYYGDEIGMVTTPPTRKEDVRDPVGITGWPKDKGRDGERTPMQWTAGSDAGFSEAGVKTWLPIPPGYTSVNVAAEQGRPDSLLTWFRNLGRLKHSDAALREGTEVILNTGDADVLSWLRQTKGEAVIVACNFTAQPRKLEIDLHGYGISGKKISTLLKTPGAADPVSLDAVALPPFGVYVGRVQ
ncbi:MAG: alpha-glucosidase [Alphaproteobacteria bacterium]|nr:alpha-glucosidase [Alphaproteobacteria bacterium]MDE2499886.1 alpha-glucosidase [Alphaproteobacteria bacterium]